MRIELLVLVAVICAVAATAAVLSLRSRRTARKRERRDRLEEATNRAMREYWAARDGGTDSRGANSWTRIRFESTDDDPTREILGEDEFEPLDYKKLKAEPRRTLHFTGAGFSDKAPPPPGDLPRVAHIAEAIADAVLPARVNDEQLGDAIERRERYLRDGRHRWWVTVWFIAQVGWAFYTAITGKGGAAPKKSAE